MKHEWDGSLIGFRVMLGDGRDCNFGFEQMPSGDFKLVWGANGDDTWRQFTEEELIKITEYFEALPEVKKLEQAYLIAHQNGATHDLFWDRQILEAFGGD